MRRQSKIFSGSLVVAAFASAVLPKTAAEDVKITFSALNNGIDNATDPECGQTLIPSGYQPLLVAYPASSTDKTIADGGKLGVFITWDGAGASNRAANPQVSDHTGDFGKAGPTLGGELMWAQGTFSMTFDRPVEIPSFFWTYFDPSVIGQPQIGTLSVFARTDDTVAAKTVTVSYGHDAGYVWAEEKGFAGMKISKIVFNPGTVGAHALNIDDITVRLPKG